jgi:hypothetical protein
VHGFVLVPGLVLVRVQVLAGKCSDPAEAGAGVLAAAGACPLYGAGLG